MKSMMNAVNSDSYVSLKKIWISFNMVKPRKPIISWSLKSSWAEVIHITKSSDEMRIISVQGDEDN